MGRDRSQAFYSARAALLFTHYFSGMANRMTFKACSATRFEMRELESTVRWSVKFDQCVSEYELRPNYARRSIISWPSWPIYARSHMDFFGLLSGGPASNRITSRSPCSIWVKPVEYDILTHILTHFPRRDPFKCTVGARSARAWWAPPRFVARLGWGWGSHAAPLGPCRTLLDTICPGLRTCPGQTRDAQT